MRTLPAYKARRDYIERPIWTLVGIDPSQVTHHAEAVVKCPTIRLGVSDECFTYCNAGANMNECPSFRATHACSDGVPPTGIDYGNGLTFCVANARIICKSKNGHCHKWTILEGKMMAGILIVYVCVIVCWEITCVIFNLGRTQKGHLCVWRRLAHTCLISTGGIHMSGVHQRIRFRLYLNLLTA